MQLELNLFYHIYQLSRELDAAYQVVNDGCMSILTDDKTFNDCRVKTIDISLVYITDKDKNLYRIELDDIIGIQFMDMMAMVGMR